MLTFQKPIEQVSESDLQRLIDTLTPESRTLEFKAELPGRTSDDRKEFLRDVVAFANSEGGHIIYGIAATDGLATNLSGIPNDTVDGELLRLEQIIRSGIEPIIHGLKLRPVPLQTNGGSALVVEIPRGLFGIHMLRNRGAFIKRTSAGKMEMDFGEIRAAFVGGETALTKLDEFRQQRIGHLKAGDGIVPMSHSAIMSIHLLPLQAFAPGYQPELKRVTHTQDGQKLLIPRKSIWGWRSHFTHHGFLQFCSAGSRAGKPMIYANLFRNGSIEVVDSDVTNSFAENSVAGVPVEFALLLMTQNLLRLFDKLEVPPPYYVLPCLLNVKGRKFIKIDYQGFPNEERPFEVDDVILPDALIEDSAQPLEQIFRPLIDVLWNTCGWSGSPNYDAEGNYTPNWRENLES
jgi:Putative DNA-binding domain